MKISAEKSWSRDIRRTISLDKERTLALFQARDSADEIEKKKIDKQIVEGNLRLVMKIAKKFQRYCDPSRLLDLCQVGHEGILKAIEKYDWRRGVSFPSYASWWIRQAVAAEARITNRDIRIPAHAAIAEKELKQAEASGRGDETLKGSAVVNDAVKYARREISIQTPFKDQHGSRVFGDTLVSDEPNVLELMLRSELRQTIKAAMSDLSLPELIALKLRFGLFDNNVTENIA